MGRRRPAHHRLLAVAAVAVVLGACGGRDGSTDPTNEATSDTSPTAGSIAVEADGESPTDAGILGVSASLVGGGDIDLAAYGDRPLLLWFWAPF